MAERVDVYPEARGTGTDLIRTFIYMAEVAEIWTIQSGIFPENTASLALHPPPLRLPQCRDPRTHRRPQWHLARFRPNRTTQPDSPRSQLARRSAWARTALGDDFRYEFGVMALQPAVKDADVHAHAVVGRRLLR